MPIWPFYGLAWLGIACAVLMLVARIARQLQNSGDDAGTPALPASH
jgi:hypothetical protein